VLASEADRLALHRHIDGKAALDRSLWAQAIELGWPAIGLPEAAGGLGFGPKGLDRLHRRLGAQAAPGPFLAALSAAQAIADAASDAVKAQWLPRLASGECRLAVAAQISPAAAAAETWIIGDEACDAALVPLSADAWGLVPLAGASVLDLWDRTRGVMKCAFGKAEPLAVLPGEATARSVGVHLCLAVASDSIGGARAIVEQTVEYMKGREQFGKPIASFQALKHRIADLMTLVIIGEEIVSLAVDTAARGSPEAPVWARLAKARATDTYVRAAMDCLQLHGGVGFTWEYDVHVFLKRAKLNELLVGTNEALKDEAAQGLVASVRSGGQPLELAI
jgi:alkylation response protein AidB-like acyl-CoA dehydrogenase